jgi:hypothetical protein
MSLNSPALTELTTESGTFKLLNEWLAQWFDGHAHGVGVNAPVVFPKANRAFNQGAPVQPLHQMGSDTDAEIRLVMHGRAENAASNDTILYQGKLVTDYVVLNFWVRAKRPGVGQSELLTQTIGERLKAILSNPDARYALAVKGIGHLQVQGPPVPVPSIDYAQRLVSCNAQLTYALQYSADAFVNVDDPNLIAGATHIVNFIRESPLLVDTYLLGYYRWSAPVQLKAAHVSAWLPQTQDVVLELESNGQLIGQQIVIPQGIANADSFMDVQFENLILQPNKAVRWRVVSAPEAEFTAWNVTVAVDVQPISLQP